MIDKCPHCGFEPLDGKLVCPRCGHEIKENIAQKLHEIDEKNRKSNDSVSWSDFEDVSLGALMSQMNEQQEPNLSSPETKEEEEEDSENPILAAYIKRHRMGVEDEGPTLEELIAANCKEPADAQSNEVLEPKQEHSEKESASAASEVPKESGELPETDPEKDTVIEPQERNLTKAPVQSADQPISESAEVHAEVKTSQASRSTEEAEAPLLKETAEAAAQNVSELTESADGDTVSPVTDASSISVTEESDDLPSKESADEQLDAKQEENATEKTVPVEAEVVANLEDEQENQQENEQKAQHNGVSTVDSNPETPRRDKAAAVSTAAKTVKALGNEPSASVSSNVSGQTAPAVTKSTLDEPSKGGRKKWPFLLAAAVVLAAGGGGYAYHQQQEQQKAQAQEQAAERAQAEAKSLQQAISALYLDEDHQFLKAGITQEELASLNSKLVKTSVDKADLEKEFAEIKTKFQLQEDVNKLFQAPVIAGSELKKDVPIQPDSALDFELPTQETPFSKLLKEAVAEFKQQQKDLAAAKTALDPLIKEGKAVANPAEADYQKAQKLVAALLTSEQKEQLQAQLKTVQAKITANKAAAAQAAEAAANQAAQTTADDAGTPVENNASDSTASGSTSGAATDNQGSSLPAEASPNMVPNTDNAPILGSVASDIADSSNPAWTWAPGIKEQVLAICKERGYIVEGGYKLEPVRIENGEGYYNLFATNNQSALTQGMADDQLPLYLVTINCKTGYFRGNGNDHTIR